MKLILVPRADPAAQNIGSQLLRLYDFKPIEGSPGLRVWKGVGLATVEDALKLSSLPFPAEEVLVASRHVSESGEPCLTAHVPGEPLNLKLGLASPCSVKLALRELAQAREELGLAYKVSMEATHHGPTELSVPVTFVEIGSQPSHWRDEKAGEAVARALMRAATSSATGPRAVGFGGPHYAPRHTTVSLSSEVCIGHVIPKYVEIREEVVRLAVERTAGGVDLFVLDWKGLTRAQRELLQGLGDELGIKVERADKLLG